MTATPATNLSNRARKHLEGMAVSRHNPPEGGFYDGPDGLHPDGIINLSTAENSLMGDEMLEFINNPTSPLFKSQHLKYRFTLLKSSVPHLDDALVKYCNDWYQPCTPVTRQTSVTGPGLGALLASLIWAVAEEGEGVLLGTPFYSDYIRDITYPSCARLVLAHIPPEVDSLSPAVLPFLRERIISSKAEGVNVRCLLLCNPHNPLPRCYPVETILGYVALAEEFGLQLIVDEAYALSVFPPTSPTTLPFIPFYSILSLSLPSLPQPLPPNIHTLISPSKDLGISALKVGLLVSTDPGVLKLVRGAMNATPISGASDAVVSRILGDQEFLRKMREGNVERLGKAWEVVRGWCEFHGLEYEPASATVYTLVDFSSVLNTLSLTHPLPPPSPSPSSPSSPHSPSTIPPPANERQDLIDLLVSRFISSGVFLKPSDLTMADPIKGRFRLVWTQKPGTMVEALRRVERACGFGEAPLS